MLNAVDGAPMLLCDVVSPKTSTEPAIEPRLYVKKLEMIVEKSQHTTRAMLIFGDLHILALEGSWKAEYVKQVNEETCEISRRIAVRPVTWRNDLLSSSSERRVHSSSLRTLSSFVSFPDSI